MKNNSNWEENNLIKEDTSVPETKISRSSGGTIHEAIFKEITSENIRLIIFNIFSWIVFLFVFIINLLWTLQISKAIDLDVTSKFRFFVPWLSVPMFVISLSLVVYAGLNRYTFNQEKNFHFNNPEEINIERVPNFVIDKYKNISGFLIFYNWFAGFSYLISTFVLIYFFSFRNQRAIELPGGLEISLTGEKTFPNYNWDIAWTFIYVGITFILHISIIIFSVREKSRLTAIFDLRKKMDYQEIKSYERKINIICFILFMLPIVIIFLSYWVSKKMRKK